MGGAGAGPRVPGAWGPGDGRKQKLCLGRGSCDVAQDVASWTRPRSCSCQLRSPAEPQFTEPESLAAAAARGASGKNN